MLLVMLTARLSLVAAVPQQEPALMWLMARLVRQISSVLTVFALIKNQMERLALQPVSAHPITVWTDIVAIARVRGCVSNVI